MIKGVKHIIAVASGKGGVGKSTVTANLALALAASGAKVGVLDADIYGPSQALLFGVGDARVQSPDQKHFQPIEALGIQLMSMAFLVDEHTPMVWRGPMVSGAFQQLLTQTAWQDLDYLLIDMPPGTGDIQLTLAQRVPVSGAVIVTTPQDLALLDARKGIEMFRKVKVPVLGIIENMSLHTCSQCGHTEAIFGSGGGEQVAETYQAPLLGQLPLAMSIRLQADQGCPSVLAEPEGLAADTFHHMAAQIVAELTQKTQAATKVQIQFSDD
ncbi:ATP-binding protein involved in chromosome partitioning [Allopseudospirillum japonicum]|uniref:Iron-sulfur cluster carrier protein n=1 Tax=Allopseudospirillum japonicum TaxID=64971 RepID=A0A1H6QBX6_9GAMM|nr:ATP-binding protein involved in chromosome partitioning [Allopseudospirillum japonicum]